MYLPYIPNTISYIRLGMIPVLWVIYLSGAEVLLACGVLLAGFTDIADGYLARRLGITQADMEASLTLSRTISWDCPS